MHQAKLPGSDQHHSLDFTDRRQEALTRDPYSHGWEISTDASESGIEVPINSSISTTSFLSGATYHALRDIFASRVRHNDRCLEEVPLTRHSWEHMDTTVVPLMATGKILGLPEDRMNAVGLAGRFHDIGYDFPEGIDPKKRGKETHKRHPEVGAALFIDTFKRLRRDNPAVAKETDWWTDEHSQLAHDAILYHSNGSAFHAEEVAIEAQFLRLYDKLHNSEERVADGQMEAAGILAGRRITSVMRHIRRNLQRVTEEAPCYSRTIDQTYDNLQKLEKRFEHTLTPYAITGQRAVLDLKEGRMAVEYQADPARLSRVLGAECTPEDFLNLFDLSHGDLSMPLAAEVVQSIRSRILKIDEPDENAFSIVMRFPDGQAVKRDIAPKAHHH